MREHSIQEPPLKEHVGFQQENIVNEMLAGEPQRIDVVCARVVFRFEVGYLQPLECVSDAVVDLLLLVSNDNNDFVHTDITEMGQCVDKNRHAIYGRQALRKLPRKGLQTIANASGKDDRLSNDCLGSLHRTIADGKTVGSRRVL